MLKALGDIAAGAISFLRTGDTPPNTPERLKEKLGDINHLSSKKFFIVFSSILILSLFYYTSVGILLSLPQVPEVVVAFTTIFTKTMEILAVIIAAYIGCQAAVDLKYNSSSNTSLQSLSQSVKEEIHETFEQITHNAKEDDYELQ